MLVPSPEIAVIEMPWLGAQIGAVETGRGHQHHAADAGRGGSAAGFGHALDRKRGCFGLAGAAFELGRRGDVGIEQIEIGKFARQQRRIGKADILVVGRNPRHRHRALGELCDAVAADVVGRDHGLALAEQHAQADIVAFGALGFLDAAVAHLDALRDVAYRDRIGRIGAGAFGRLDKALRQRAQRALVEQIGFRWMRPRASKRRMVKSSRTKSRQLIQVWAQIGRPCRCA